MENQLEDAFRDKEISEMREKLSKRPDILKEYDNVIRKIVNNEFGEKLINEMHRLLGAIIGDISAKRAIEDINNTYKELTDKELVKQEENNTLFTIHKNVMILFNYINLCIVERIK